MANITIVKLKVRRGSDVQRKQITLDQGEVGYTLDTRRLFVGDGSTLGGRVIGNISLGPFTSITNLGPDNAPGLQVGDIGYANSKLYRLTSFNYDDALSGYAYIGNLPDNNTLEFGEGDHENKLTIKKNPGPLNAEYFALSTFGAGLLSSRGEISVNYNSTYFNVSGSKLSPKVGSITQREIASTALGPGISGGNATTEDAAPGVILSVQVNPDQFTFDSGGTISLDNIGTATIPISSWAGGGDTGTRLGAGLNLTNTGILEATVQGAPGGDGNVSLINNQISLANNSSLTGQELSYASVTHGLVTELRSSIYDVVTGLGLSGQNVSDSIPIGAIIPHSNAFTTPPAGYLLCNGHDLLITSYQALYDVIGTRFGSRAGDTFTLPCLTGGDVFNGAAGSAMAAFLYGTDGTPEGGTSTIFLSGGDKYSVQSAVSGLGVNYIIKYKEDPLRGIFNGCPDQINAGLVGEYDNQVYECLDSAGANIQLSSGGFLRFALSGYVRSEDGGMFNRFAIPVYNW